MRKTLLSCAVSALLVWGCGDDDGGTPEMDAGVACAGQLGVGTTANRSHAGAPDWVMGL